MLAVCVHDWLITVSWHGIDRKITIAQLRALRLQLAPKR